MAKIGYILEWEKLLIIIQQGWQLQVMTQMLFSRNGYNEKVSRANKANAIAYNNRERITEFKINWNIISWPGKAYY